MEEVIDSIISVANKNGRKTSLRDVLSPLGDLYMESFDNYIHVMLANDCFEGVTDVKVELFDATFGRFSAPVKNVLFTFDFGYSYDVSRVGTSGVSLGMETDEDGCEMLRLSLN
mgnify:CR=1 FL=1